MNKKLFLSVVLMGALFTSCKKEDEAAPTTTTTTPTLTYLIYMDSITSTDLNHTTEVRKFTYNSSKRLIKVEHKYLPSTTYSDYDTLIYTSGGQLVSNANYSIGNVTPNKTYGLNYNGSAQISTISEGGFDDSNSPATPYAKTHTLAYTAGKLSSMTSVYTLGANGNSNDTITNIVYNGDNVASVIFNNKAITTTTSTTAPNPYYGLGLDPSDFVNLVNKNNMIKAYFTSDPTLILQDDTYIYANGRVATIISNEWDNGVVPNVIKRNIITTITYKGY